MSRLPWELFSGYLELQKYFLQGKDQGFLLRIIRDLLIVNEIPEFGTKEETLDEAVEVASLLLVLEPNKFPLVQFWDLEQENIKTNPG